jgi:hypothetical protein
MPLKSDQKGNIYTAFNNVPDLSKTLLMFGLIERRERPQQLSNQNNPFIRNYPLYTHIYTQKMDRLKYWLAVNGLEPETIEWSIDQAP